MLGLSGQHVRRTGGFVGYEATSIPWSRDCSFDTGRFHIYATARADIRFILRRALLQSLPHPCNKVT